LCAIFLKLDVARDQMGRAYGTIEYKQPAIFLSNRNLAPVAVRFAFPSARFDVQRIFFYVPFVALKLVMHFDADPVPDANFVIRL